MLEGSCVTKYYLIVKLKPQKSLKVLNFRSFDDNPMLQGRW